MPRSSQVSDDQLAQAVLVSKTMAEVLRAVGLKYAGGTHALYRKRIDRLGLDTSHFVGSAGSYFRGSNKRNPEDILQDDPTAVYRSKTYQLRRALQESGVDYACSECGQLPFWNSKSLTLQIEHINGNNRDNRKENLCFLCPNCHTQTPTYGRNRNVG